MITITMITMIAILKGEMLWYESARLVHGRPQPLQGKMYVDEDFVDEDEDGEDYIDEDEHEHLVLL